MTLQELLNVYGGNKSANLINLNGNWIGSVDFTGHIYNEPNEEKKYDHYTQEDFLKSEVKKFSVVHYRYEFPKIRIILNI